MIPSICYKQGKKENKSLLGKGKQFREIQGIINEIKRRQVEGRGVL